MKYKTSSLLLLCSAVIIFFVNVSFVKSDSKEINWEKQKIEKGLVLKHSHTNKLFNSIQNVNILEVNTRKKNMTLVYNREQNVKTSQLAGESKATAAINAGFFDTKKGGSVTYIKVDGEVYEEDSVKWQKLTTLNGALIIKTNGQFEMEPTGDCRKYTANEEYDDVLVTGCLLIDDGKRMELPDYAFVNDRHPRTCLGIVSKNKILLVTTDGRSEQAAGMSLHELTDFMEMLGCKEAINLDGGGSTAMWINNSGIVNMPSDNKKFDHEGERAVSNILIVE